MAKIDPEDARLLPRFKEGRVVRVPYVPKAGRLAVLKKNKSTKKIRKTIPAPKLKPSITPGTVLIVLAGPYKGKRIVFLKQFESGALLATGPFKTNGFPLRRVHQRFVLATSTKIPVDISSLDCVTESMFKKDRAAIQRARRAASTQKENEDVFMSQGSAQPKRELPQEKLDAQDKIDKSINEYLSQPGNELLKQYLKTRFTLTDRMYPHALKF